MAQCISAQKHCILLVIAPIKKKGKTASDRQTTYSVGMEKNKERGRRRERLGRESPECKAMFSRNVLPPVCSCNLTGNSPESCLTQTGSAGGTWKIRWIRWEGDGWRARRVAHVIADRFSCFHNFKLCIPDSNGRYGDIRYTAGRCTFFSRQRDFARAFTVSSR